MDSSVFGVLGVLGVLVDFALAGFSSRALRSGPLRASGLMKAPPVRCWAVFFLRSRGSFVGAPPTFYDLQTCVSVVAYARCLAQFRGIPGGYVGLTAATPQDGAGVSLHRASKTLFGST